ncbi:MAG: menaquinone biosynthesis protein [Nitrospinae bacterium]|jgi:chorismate dehydratase|nr:menaquinone biosynthesis protein [Nitrospinota bacterium]MDA1109558.1 menaquinone biosynthesis protein [Nitrospinota bacterium]
MSQKILRFGLHEFLNAQPLLVPLLNIAEETGLEMVIDVPSQLAEMLKAGSLDLAMIPTVEYLKEADRYRLAGVCIASRNRVATVLLISKVPVEDIKSLALDERSRTSVALLKILFAKRFSPEIAFDPSPPDPAAMLKTHDAALIIGDQNFSLPTLPNGIEIYDLSEEWFQKTGKTFVHAVLAVREGVTLGKNICDAIQSARREGLLNLAFIASNFAGSKGLDSAICEDYLRNKIIYDLGQEELEGMTLFQQLCYEQGLIAEKYRCQFVGD